jgi:hypothetical protein
MLGTNSQLLKGIVTHKQDIHCCVHHKGLKVPNEYTSGSSMESPIDHPQSLRARPISNTSRGNSFTKDYPAKRSRMPRGITVRSDRTVRDQMIPAPTLEASRCITFAHICLEPLIPWLLARRRGA